MDYDVVTGSTGQVGLELCRALVMAGRPVRAVVLPGDPAAPRLSALGVSVAHADVRDTRGLRAACEGARHLYHLAAIVSTTPRHDPLMWQVNVEGTRHVATLARELAVARMIYFSSIVVFDPAPLDEPLDERRARLAVAGTAPYVASKIVGEQVVREQIDRGLDAVIVHPTVVIGPNETHHLGVVRSVLHPHFARRLPVVFSGGFDAVASSDVVAGAMAAAARGRRGESYILSGQWHTIRDLLRRIQPRSRAPLPRLALPIALARAVVPLAGLAARISRTVPMVTPEDLRQLAGNRRISCAKARAELGYDAVGLDAILHQIHAEWDAARRPG